MGRKSIQILSLPFSIASASLLLLLLLSEMQTKCDLLCRVKHWWNEKPTSFPFFSFYVPITPSLPSFSFIFRYFFRLSLVKVFFGWYLSVQLCSQAMFIVGVQCVLWRRKNCVYELWGACIVLLLLLLNTNFGNRLQRFNISWNSILLERKYSHTHTHTPRIPAHPANSRSIFGKSMLRVDVCVWVFCYIFLMDTSHDQSNNVPNRTKSLVHFSLLLFLLSLSPRWDWICLLEWFEKNRKRYTFDFEF